MFKEEITQYCKNYFELKQQLDQLKAENEKLKAELQRYKDMETKGLEEFKDVGGCWGCGIQSSLDQITKDYTELKAENEELKRKVNDKHNLLMQYVDNYDQIKAENDQLKKEREKTKNYNLEYGQLLIKATNKNNKLSKTLAEIKEIAEAKLNRADRYLILQKINEVEDDKSNN